MVWVGLVLGVQLVVRFAGAETSNDLRLPGTESQQATDLLTSRFPRQQNGSSPFVFHVAKGKITDTANKQAVESAYKALAKAPHVASAPDPFANAASGLVGKDATTAFTPVLLDIPNGDVTEELADDLLATTAPARKAGVGVAVGGSLGSVLSKSPTESSEVIGLLAAMLILFGGATWWLPGWLSRLLPHVDIEGGQASPPPAPKPAGEAAPGAAMRAASRRRR